MTSLKHTLALTYIKFGRSLHFIYFRRKVKNFRNYFNPEVSNSRRLKYVFSAELENFDFELINMELLNYDTAKFFNTALDESLLHRYHCEKQNIVDLKIVTKFLDRGFVLFAVISYFKPNYYLDLGTKEGKSALIAKRASESAGITTNIITFDIDKYSGSILKKLPQLGERVIGDSVCELKKLEEIFHPTLVFSDSTNTDNHILNEIETCLDRISSEFVFLCDANWLMRSTNEFSRFKSAILLEERTSHPIYPGRKLLLTIFTERKD
jgi:hypothetical protein